MILFISCADYLAVIREEADDCNAPAICAELELARNDGYAVLASRDGRLFADAEGYREHSPGSPPYDAATATGMYDAW